MKFLLSPSRFWCINNRYNLWYPKRNNIVISYRFTTNHLTSLNATSTFIRQELHKLSFPSVKSQVFSDNDTKSRITEIEYRQKIQHLFSVIENSIDKESIHPFICMRIWNNLIASDEKGIERIFWISRVFPISHHHLLLPLLPLIQNHPDIRPLQFHLLLGWLKNDFFWNAKALSSDPTENFLSMFTKSYDDLMDLTLKVILNMSKKLDEVKNPKRDKKHELRSIPVFSSLTSSFDSHLLAFLLVIIQRLDKLRCICDNTHFRNNSINIDLSTHFLKRLKQLSKELLCLLPPWMCGALIIGQWDRLFIDTTLLSVEEEFGFSMDGSSELHHLLMSSENFLTISIKQVNLSLKVSEVEVSGSVTSRMPSIDGDLSKNDESLIGTRIPVVIFAIEDWHRCLQACYRSSGVIHSICLIFDIQWGQIESTNNESPQNILGWLALECLQPLEEYFNKLIFNSQSSESDMPTIQVSLESICLVISTALDYLRTEVENDRRSILLTQRSRLYRIKRLLLRLSEGTSPQNLPKEGNVSSQKYFLELPSIQFCHIFRRLTNLTRSLIRQAMEIKEAYIRGLGAESILIPPEERTSRLLSVSTRSLSTTLATETPFHEDHSGFCEGSSEFTVSVLRDTACRVFEPRLRMYYSSETIRWFPPFCHLSSLAKKVDDQATKLEDLDPPPVLIELQKLIRPFLSTANQILLSPLAENPVGLLEAIRINAMNWLCEETLGSSSSSNSLLLSCAEAMWNATDRLLSPIITASSTELSSSSLVPPISMELAQRIGWLTYGILCFSAGYYHRKERDSEAWRTLWHKWYGIGGEGWRRLLGSGVLTRDFIRPAVIIQQFIEANLPLKKDDLVMISDDQIRSGGMFEERWKLIDEFSQTVQLLRWWINMLSSSSFISVVSKFSWRIIKSPQELILLADKLGDAKNSPISFSPEKEATNQKAVVISLWILPWHVMWHSRQFFRLYDEDEYTLKTSTAFDRALEDLQTYVETAIARIKDSGWNQMIDHTEPSDRSPELTITSRMVSHIPLIRVLKLDEDTIFFQDKLLGNDSWLIENI